MTKAILENPFGHFSLNFPIIILALSPFMRANIFGHVLGLSEVKGGYFAAAPG
jgi:hypothetical protein